MWQSWAVSLHIRAAAKKQSICSLVSRNGTTRSYVEDPSITWLVTKLLPGYLSNAHYFSVSKSKKVTHLFLSNHHHSSFNRTMIPSAQSYLHYAVHHGCQSREMLRAQPWSPTAPTLSIHHRHKSAVATSGPDFSKPDNVAGSTIDVLENIGDRSLSSCRGWEHVSKLLLSLPTTRSTWWFVKPQN